MESEQVLLSQLSSLLDTSRSETPLITLSECHVYACEKCQLTFESLVDLHQHLDDTHVSLGQEESHAYILCEECNAPFINVPMAVRHAQLRHKESKPEHVLKAVHVVTHLQAEGQRQGEAEGEERQQLVLLQQREEQERRRRQSLPQRRRSQSPQEEEAPLVIDEQPELTRVVGPLREERLVPVQLQPRVTLQQRVDPPRHLRPYPSRDTLARDRGGTVHLEILLDDEKERASPLSTTRSSRPCSLMDESDGPDVSDSLEIVLDETSHSKSNSSKYYRRDQAVHVRRERDRRRSMGEGYERLAQLSKTKGCSKADVLQGATAFIRRLENDQLALAAKIIELRDRNKALTRRKLALEKALDVTTTTIVVDTGSHGQKNQRMDWDKDKVRTVDRGDSKDDGPNRDSLASRKSCSSKSTDHLTSKPLSSRSRPRILAARSLQRRGTSESSSKPFTTTILSNSSGKSILNDCKSMATTNMKQMN